MWQIVSIISFCLSTVAAVCGLRLIITSVTAHWNEPLCPQCGYDLRGRTARLGKCPECGCECAAAEKPFIERQAGRAFYGVIIVLIACLGYGAMFIASLLK